MTKVLLSQPSRPASHNSSRAMVWVRKNLFSSWSNSLLTIGCIWLMWELIPPLLNWTFLQANWVAQRVPTAQKPVPVGSSSTNDLVSLCMDFTHTTNAGELTWHY